MLRDLNPKKALWLSMTIVILLLVLTGFKQLPSLLAADMPNPDSYTKLVLIRDWQLFLVLCFLNG